MTLDAHANFASGQVVTAPSPATSGTSLTVGTGSGSLFPAPPFNAVVVPWPIPFPPEAPDAEIVRVTAGPPGGDTFTITRAQESTSARSIAVGNRIYAVPTAKTFTDLETPPAARVYNSATISHATSGTAQPLTFDSERFDTDSIHSTSTNTGRLVCNTAGVYLFTGCVQFAFHATGRRVVQIRLNGSAAQVIAQLVVPAVTSDSAGTILDISTIYKLAAGDYAELHTNQTSGGALNMTALTNYAPEFGMSYMGTG